MICVLFSTLYIRLNSGCVIGIFMTNARMLCRNVWKPVYKNVSYIITQVYIMLWFIIFDPLILQLKFLQNFGYLEKSNGEIENFYSGEAVVEAIKEMQKFGDIPQTGLLDNTTVQVNKSKILIHKNYWKFVPSNPQLLHKPRCGVSDVARTNDPQATASLSLKRRTKRWVKGSEGWRKRTITYLWVQKSAELEIFKVFF